MRLAKGVWRFGLVVFGVASSMFLAFPTQARLFKDLKPERVYESPGGDERDLMDFYPGVLTPSGAVTLTITPQGDQPRVVILFNAKQVEVQRAIMSRTPISFTVASSEGYAFIRVVPVGGSYDAGAGERYHRFAKVEGSSKILLQPYSARVTIGDDVDQPDTVGPVAQIAAVATVPHQQGHAQGLSPSTAILRPRLMGPRIALVIGNGGYGGSLGSLANPAGDARAVGSALTAVGFVTTIVRDADQKTMKRAIAAFGKQLSAAGKGATGLFYYAGHGIQSRGINFLVPIGAAIETEADVDIEAVAADGVLRQMEEAGTSTSIVILDACRNLPVQRAFRDGIRGLARMEAPNGSFVAYSTAPGSVAADGSGANSPFAAALVAEMKKPGQPIEATFRNVRRAVVASTGGKQTPWDSSSLMDSFVFLGE